MLINFSTSNFRSFSDCQAINMMKSSLKDESETQFFSFEDTEYLNKFSLLKSAAIYGSNAAGKSNFIKAIATMKKIVLNSAKSGQRGDSLSVTPFKLKSSNLTEPSEFEVNIIADGVRYQYGFSTTTKRIIAEWLFAFPKGRPQTWFSREWDKETKDYEWHLGSNLSGEKQTWKNATRENALFLSTAVQLNSEQLKPVFDWFKLKLQLIGVNGFPIDYTAEYCHEGHTHKVLNFLKEADLGISNINVTSDKFDPNQLPDNMPEDLKNVVLNEFKDHDVYEVKIVHQNQDGEDVNFDIDEESTGTQKLFAFSGPWLDVLERGLVLLVDELHDNLHPRLVQYLVELFHNKKTNPHNAQLIFTTHETSILNQEVFRRDQVWFCEKNESQSSELYPLLDFTPRKGKENLEASYLSGRYGAVPYVRNLF